MTGAATTFRGGVIFDGETLREGHALRLEEGRVTALVPEAQIPASPADVDLQGDILAPGYVDLQVNGGDGLMFNDDPGVATLTRMAQAHRRLGTAAILPTLITDTPDQTRAAIEAVAQACALGIDGIAGLHLEGPHLSQSRKGAHDGSLIRPMTEADLHLLLDAAARLPRLKVTIASENVTLEQAQTLAAAGVLLSLGHTDADYDTCCAYQAAGVRCVTHLFNAMSQMGNRAPGVVGAALDQGGLSAGLIADGIHVHPATMRAALSAKRGPGQVFLVTDAMAPAGTDLAAFELNGRVITRAGGRLTLADGTLAGADLDFTRAIRVLVQEVGIPLADALRAATSVPAALAGLPFGRIETGSAGPLIRISAALESCQPLAIL